MIRNRYVVCVAALLIISAFALTSCPEMGGVQIKTLLDGAPMGRVAGGEFTMGSNSGDDDERPEHRVLLAAYWIDQFEVTNELYAMCVKAGKCGESQKFQGFGAPRQPVVGVTWQDAVNYCEWTGKRLPTEAEWELAARGPDGREYPWGSGLDCTKANYRECGRNTTTEAGQYTDGVSPFNAYEMAGNVSEWVQDWYDPKYYGISPKENPTGPETGKFKVIRGGMWHRYAYQMRSADRAAQNHGTRSNSTGFRCAADG